MILRLFKTRHFAASASKARIFDAELIEAFSAMLKGTGRRSRRRRLEKRLNHNRHRSIVLAKGGHYWVYQFLFAKKDQSNISQNELAGFRVLAKVYEGLNSTQIQQLLDIREFVEIHHDQKI